LDGDLGYYTLRRLALLVMN